MADEADPTKPYADAIGNFRDTTKWVISSAAAIGALIVGGSSLSGIGALGFGLRFVLAFASSLVAIVLVGIVIFLAVRVMSATSGIGLRALAEKRAFGTHRDGIARDLASSFPPATPDLPSLVTEYERLRDRAQAGDAGAAQSFQTYAKYVAIILAYAKWVEFGQRFRTAMTGFGVALGAIVVCLYAFIWAANPPKDIGRDLDTPVTDTLRLAPGEAAKLTAAGLSAGCIPSPLPVLVYRQEPPDLVDAFTLPPRDCPPKRLLYQPKKQRILSVH